MSSAGPRTRSRVALAFLMALLALAFAASTAHAESWGKIASFPLENPKPLFENDSTENPVKFAAGSDGSYYLLWEEEKASGKAELVLQRFDEQEEEKERKEHGTTSFKPQAEIVFKPPKGSEEGKAMLAVDPSRDRVYVMLAYERSEQSAKELKEEQETKQPVFPLDQEMPAAGALYAFEYNGKELVSSKQGSKKEALPLLAEEELKAQGEVPGEALLDPRGITVEPKTGDLAISGNQDDEPNAQVEEYEESKHVKGAQKQCRAAVQFVKVTPSEGKITGLSLGARYVDTNGDVLFKKTGCGGREEEGGVDQAPASPVFAPDGSLLGYGEDTEVAVEPEPEPEEAEGIIWQLAPKGADEGLSGEVKSMAPKELFVASSVPAFYPDLEEDEEPASVMSMVPESGSDTEGTIYLSGRGNELLGKNESPAVLVLHYSDDGGTPSVSEDGWTAGGEPAAETDGPGPCNLHTPETKPIMVGGLAGSKRGVLALTYYKEANEHKTEYFKRAEAVEFGEGSTDSSACPQAPVTTPTQEHLGEPTNKLPAGAELNVTSFVGTADELAASPKSAKWTVKYTPTVGSAETKEIVEGYEYNGLHEVPAGYGEELALNLGPAQAGVYEISVEVHTDDLADEVVKSGVDEVIASASKVTVKAEAPNPTEVNAREQEAQLSAKVEGEAKLHIKKVVWEFGDGTPNVEQPAEELANGGQVTVKHAFDRCGSTEKTTCKIKVTVESESSEASATFEIKVNENHFEKEGKSGEYALLIAKAGSGSGEVECEVNGGEHFEACATKYSEGTKLVLKGARTGDSTFAGWSGGTDSAASCGGTSNCAFTFTAISSVTATFEPPAVAKYELKVDRAGSGSGTVTSSPAGIDCGATCEAGFEVGKKVTLTEAPESGSTFAGWSGGGCSGTASTCEVTMSAAETVTATFNTEKLTVTKEGTGKGTVECEVNGGGHFEGCVAGYAEGTKLVLKGTAETGSTFAGWSGGSGSASSCSGTGNCSFTIKEASAVTATFNTEKLTVTKAGTGKGTVTSSPAGIDCGATCEAGFEVGKKVTLTEAPESGSTFAGWSGGGCSGTASTCEVTMSAAETVTATFNTEKLTVTKEGTGKGTVECEVNGGGHFEGCVAGYAEGTKLVLKGTAETGSTFAGWSGGSGSASSCSGTGNCSFTIKEASAVTATFNTEKLTVTKAGTGKGTVTSSPAGIDCGATCEAGFEVGKKVTLTEAPESGSTFAGWSGGGCSGTASTCEVTMSAAETVTATFNTTGVNKGPEEEAAKKRAEEEAAAARKHAEEEAAAKKHAEEEAAKGGIAGYIASFTGSSLTVSAQGATSVRVTCPSAGSCSGTLTLRTLNAVAASGAKHAKKKVLTLASGDFSLFGGSKSVGLHLNSTALTLLRHSHGVLRVKLTVLSRGTAGRSNSSTTHIVTVRLVQKHKKH